MVLMLIVSESMRRSSFSMPLTSALPSIFGRLQHLAPAEREQPLRQLGAALARLHDRIGQRLQVRPRLQAIAQAPPRCRPPR